MTSNKKHQMTMGRTSITVWQGWCSLLICLWSSAVWGTCLGQRDAARVLRVEIVPQLPRTVTYAKWAPLLEQVGRSTGECFDLVIPDTIPAFERSLLQGKPDFGFANPYHEVMAWKRQGYRPLLIDGRLKLTGIVTVKNDSSIRTIHDLQDKVVAFPAPNAFAASLLIRAELAKQGIRIQPRYVQTHANAYRAVAMGEVVAAGGVNNTLQREDPALRDSLRVLYETAGYAPHPFVVHPRVSARTQKAVQMAIMSLATHEAGKKLLDDVQLSSPKLADYRRDFAPLDRLHLDKFLMLDE